MISKICLAPTEIPKYEYHTLSDWCRLYSIPVGQWFMNDLATGVAVHIGQAQFTSMTGLTPDPAHCFIGLYRPVTVDVVASLRQIILTPQGK